MVGVQDEDAVQRAHQHRIGYVIFSRRGKHHVHEIFRVAELVLRVHERGTGVVFMRHRRNGRHFGQHAHRGNIPVFGIIDVQRVVIERGQRAHHADHHRHRMRIAAEAGEETRHLVMHHGVLRHLPHESGLGCRIGQFAVQQQITHFEEIGMLGQLLDRIAAVVKQARHRRR